MNDQAVLAAIRDADFGKPGLACRRLFMVDPEFFGALRHDVLLLRAQHRGSDATGRGHVTAWTRPYGRVEQWSLLNRSGRFDDPGSDHDLCCLGKQFRHATRYPALGRFIGLFPHCVNFRINSLASGGGLSLHKEHVTQRIRGGGVGIKARFHLPLLTNEACEVVLGSRIYHLTEGIVYFVNNGCVHGARNGGTTVRLHLVWDMLLTRETCRFMFGTGPLAGPVRRVAVTECDPRPSGEIRVDDAVIGGTRPVSWAEAAAVTFFHVQ